jgi:hypothetical protein
VADVFVMVPDNQTNRRPMTEQLRVRVRKFLQEFFDDEELTTFCFDYFPQIHNDFPQAMPLNQKILRLVSFSLTSTSFPHKLILVLLAGAVALRSWTAARPLRQRRSEG